MPSDGSGSLPAFARCGSSLLEFTRCCSCIWVAHLGDCALLMWLSGSLKLGLRILALPAILLFVGLGVVTGFQAWSAVWWLSASLLTCGAVVWSWLSAPDEARQLVSGVTKRVLSLGGEKQS